MYKLLSDVIKNMWSINDNGNNVVLPDEFVSECYRTMANVLAPRRQHDITEFVMTLFDLGSDTLRPTPVRKDPGMKPIDLMLAKIHTAYQDNVEAASPLARCALLQTVAQMSCGACGKKEHRFEHTTMLFVPPSNLQSISLCVQKAFDCETKNDWTCDHCKKCVPSKLSRKMSKLPKVLIVAINRFDANMDKIKDEVVVDYEIDVSPHTMLQPRSVPMKYRLVAMACHSGSGMQYGHYYTVAWCGNAWVRYDDECREVEARDRGVSSGFKSRDAYLAFYTQQEE